MNKATQCERILNLLTLTDYLKSDDIVYKLGIPRASARILDLKMRGYAIGGFWQEFAGKKKYCYKLVK